ncbi:MAG: 4Fe-4S dicluster domain-containing protein [Gammaproteobacteria bacterium]|nr:MAG: 4Fe-4S dicluster domain-containing protein [Gammaproteobacteria bacterium]
MKTLSWLWLNLSLTLLRVLPFPCRTGLVRVGNPGPSSPVLLTGNYRLTVARVLRALAGLDVWLLVANSRGINVWCAASGGHLGNHDVISVLRTSGIEKRVGHRDLVLPQLAATGIEERVIRERTGWQVHWGPVEARDVPAYLESGMQATPAMRRVTFPWPRRLEMALAWAFPISQLAWLLWPLWREAVLPLMAVVWGLALALFLGFPLYRRLLRPHPTVGLILFDFGPGAVLLLLWAATLLLLCLHGLHTGELSWGYFGRWALATLILLLILGLDLTGSTPTYKSGLHPERHLRITLDAERCRGAGRCEEVCPEGVFTVDRQRHLATLPGIDRCVQCGACIVQCPCDALSFQGPDGTFVPPETVRRFKLNLLGKRMVRRD